MIINLEALQKSTTKISVLVLDKIIKTTVDIGCPVIAANIADITVLMIGLIAIR